MSGLGTAGFPRVRPCGPQGRTALPGAENQGRGPLAQLTVQGRPEMVHTRERVVLAGQRALAGGCSRTWPVEVAPGSTAVSLQILPGSSESGPLL